MAAPNVPLKYPEHYPPTDRWKKFFIGVRWLGPDLSFFNDLKSQQASRVPEQMSIWGGGLRQELAEIFSNILHSRLRWSTAVFLPQDKFEVICYGPKFDRYDDDFVLEEAIEEIELKLNIKIPVSFLQDLEAKSFGEVIDKIARTQSST